MKSINQKINNYSNVKLIDIIKNSTNKSEAHQAKLELESRKLTKKKMAEVEADYLNYKNFQRKRKDEPLNTEEWLTFFLLPFFTPRSKWREDHYSESEVERFEKYGFDKKAKQAYKVKVFGVLFWSLVILLGMLIFN